MPVALDTSFLVDLLRGDPGATERLETLSTSRQSIAIPAPALYELLSGVRVHRGAMGSRRVEAILDQFPTLPLDREAARRAAEVRAELTAIGRVKPHIDVLIAGIALRFDASLVSRDTDFDAIKDVTGLDVVPY